jgi:hypothetical protein
VAPDQMPIWDVKDEKETGRNERDELGESNSEEPLSKSVPKCTDCYLRSQAILVERGIQCRRLKLQSKATQTQSWR